MDKALRSTAFFSYRQEYRQHSKRDCGDRIYLGKVSQTLLGAAMLLVCASSFVHAVALLAQVPAYAFAGDCRIRR